MPSAGPPISGNDQIAGNTGIAGTGTTSGEDFSTEGHNPGGTPTV
jgi:hypothetical protein